jgi:hypothetical protein
MDMGILLLLTLFALTVGHLVTLKLCSARLDHRSAPLFISGWTLAGVALVAPLYGGLLAEGWEKFVAAPWLLALAALRGGLLYLLFVISQRLTQVSLSSRHYVTPLSVGLLTIANSFFGESLKAHQWFSAIGLCALAAGFFLRGHLADLSAKDRMAYAQLVVLAAATGTLDQIVIRGANWYALLIVSNLVLLGLSLALHARDKAVLKAAFLTRAAALAGFFYAATELVKFYQQVTINPVTVVVTVQAATKPVILILSALIWKERTVKEQLAWGLLAFLITLPLFLPDAVIARISRELPF